MNANNSNNGLNADQDDDVVFLNQRQIGQGERNLQRSPVTATRNRKHVYYSRSYIISS